ncbi:glycosyltransferase [Novosphingobium sp. FGD1]|uniref:Glycosyltransferase n=1 Tax=Novosphingobium silvae TaxID=2692619 RepID=A0A7X4GJ18_9SPHN|nr:glycosyltransferase [Novosphingobium silvae]
MSLPANLASPQDARVSIAMATYNGARFIQEQLDSFLAQTHLPWELVITDDQSSDETQQIVEKFTEVAPFKVRFIRNEQRLYFSSNFMKAASLCEGDFIAFSDQDDIWEPNKIEMSLEALARPGVVLCVHDALKFTKKGEPAGLETRKVPKGEISVMDPLINFSGFVCTFPRALIDIIDYNTRPMDVIEEERKVSHDRWVTQLALLSGKIYNLPDKLANYRQHDQNVSGFARIERSKKEIIKSIRLKYDSYLLKRKEFLEEIADLSEGIDVNEWDSCLFSEHQLKNRQEHLRQHAYIFSKRLKMIRGNKIAGVARYISYVTGGMYRQTLGGIKQNKNLALDALAICVAKRRKY